MDFLQLMKMKTPDGSYSGDQKKWLVSSIFGQAGKIPELADGLFWGADAE
ncbi:MAG: hypothetical protein LBJ64_03120 [Deltaproteobacteria bacterium]|jgi:hypothetical protein|nr:hypothetical protein [Deltaproteobacteria bacterium]